ncbi:MAG: hypothetical protein NVV62_14290 [Terricaulis sp.]|nr:hypothetical protein [Terricaulis sp.]
MSEVAAWMSTMAAIAAAIAAFLTQRTASRQSEALERQLQISLFEPRCAIFDLISSVESEMFTHGEPRPEYMHTLVDQLQRSGHLFGPDVRRRISELLDALIDWQVARATYEPGDSPTMSDRVQSIRAIKGGLLATMRPYLALHDVSRLPRPHPLSWIDNFLDWLEGKSR